MAPPLSSRSFHKTVKNISEGARIRRKRGRPAGRMRRTETFQTGKYHPGDNICERHFRIARARGNCDWKLLPLSDHSTNENGRSETRPASKLQNFLNSSQIFRIASTIFLAVPKSSVSAFPAALAACTAPRSTMRMRARCSIPCTISNSLPIPTGGRPRACTQGARLRDFIYTLQRPDVGLLGGAGSRPHSTQLTRSYI